MHQLPEIGTKVELHYPTCTSVLSTSKRWTLREIEVKQIRDLVSHPLTLAEFIRRPFIYRSRYLILGNELGQDKQFYLGTAREYFSTGQLRLGLYKPGRTVPTRLVSRPFENTPFDRRLLYRAVVELMHFDFGQLQLRIFADDMRITF
jgi:hypothetical protein